jgi:hypothetical protein
LLMLNTSKSCIGSVPVLTNPNLTGAREDPTHPPSPAGIPGSRKAAPKPKPKAKQKRRRRVPHGPRRARYEYEIAPELKAGVRPKKRKPAKKR